MRRTPFRIAGLLVLAALVCLPEVQAQDSRGSTEDRPLIERIRALDVDSLHQGVVVYYASGYEERAQELGPMVAEATAFFEDSLGVALDFRLALLEEPQWREVAPSPYPYGLPFVSGTAPAVAALPAGGGGAVYEATLPLEEEVPEPTRRRLAATGHAWEEAVRTMIDLIVFHEIGHAYADAYGIGRPARWFNEFIASYFSYAFMHSRRPEAAELWDVMAEAIAGAHDPAHRTLEEFEELYAGVGAGDYGWYQSAFELRANRVFEEQGLAFLREVKEAYPAGTEPASPYQVMSELEAMAPGFEEWAAIFEPDLEHVAGVVFPPGLPFSEAVRVGDVLYLAGSIGTEPGTAELVSGGIEAEARQAMENIKKSLDAAGSSMERIARCTVFLADMDEWEAFNEVYETYFEAPYPARSAVGVSELAFGARVEIECTAAAGRTGETSKPD